MGLSVKQQIDEFYAYYKNNREYIKSKTDKFFKEKQVALVSNSSARFYFNDILSQAVKIFDELNIKDPSEIYCAFMYMLKAGYFSVDKTYKYFRTANHEITYKAFHIEGIKIVSGEGNCLNDADALCYFEEAMDHKAVVIHSKFCEPSELANTEKRLRGIFLNRFYEWNHACSTIRKTDNRFIYDSTNVVVFDLVDFALARKTFGPTDKLLYISPLELLYRGIEIDEAIEILSPYKKSFFDSKKIQEMRFLGKSITLSEMISKTYNLLEANQARLEEFYETTESSRKYFVMAYKK